MGDTETSSGYRRHAIGVMLRVAFPLIGVFLLTLGTVGSITYGVLPLFDAVRSRHWQPVMATLEAVTVEPPTAMLRPPLERIGVRYRYVYDKAEYVGGRLDPQDGRYSHRRGKEVVERLRSQTELEVWVNPSNPRESLVHREVRPGVALYGLPAFAMAVAGGISLFAGMLAWDSVPLGTRRQDSNLS
ncbi:DUF3592 domain-containing protein [Azoarcus sp. KH32C]|uniref:DUF3592 domain-containing protein n=1 Tax=Azoarcus sp. KH32C TaxID=748247 RepID=UPI0002386319|nr:DUF3592 domain-containing protein [Azoarcus sp. KH32C]BAL26803.1 hypothetical protein AZKH_4530 [Azoarcus sp. KH32C]